MSAQRVLLVAALAVVSVPALACKGADNGACCGRRLDGGNHAQRASAMLSDTDREAMTAAIASVKDMAIKSPALSDATAQQVHAALEAGKFGADDARAKAGFNATIAAGPTDDCDCDTASSMDGRTTVIQGRCPMEKK